jgi:predicted histone-like DNA-binding protein
MPITLKTVRRINPRNPQEEGKYYVKAIIREKTALDSFCRRIGDHCSLQPLTIKAVLFALEDQVMIELSRGNSANLGVLGSFRISVKSEGTAELKKAKAKNIRSAKIIYTPGKELRKMLKKLDFEWS